MYKTLIKHNFIAVLPMTSSFHYHIQLTEYVKMSNSLLKLNYSHYSPFSQPEILSYYDGVYLHLWFYQTKNDALVIVPEAYLLFLQLKEKYNDTAVVMQDSSYKIFMIQNKQLLSAFVAKEYNEQLLQLSMDQNSLSNITTLSENESQKSQEHILDTLSLAELLRWKNSSLDLKAIGLNSIERIAFPATVFLGVILSMQIIHDQMLNTKLTDLKEQYTTFKNSNDSVRSEIRKKKSEQKRWNSFLQKELIYPDTMSILEAIIEALPDNKTDIKSIQIVNGLVTITIESNTNQIKILNKFIDIKSTTNVSIKRSYKPKRKKRVIIYEMDLVPIRKSL